MKNHPFPLTPEEIREISSIPVIQQMWGCEETNEMIEMLKADIYAVRFNFRSGSPGYCGDLFILQSDCLQEGSTLTLIRDNGKIRLTEYE